MQDQSDYANTNLGQVLQLLSALKQARHEVTPAFDDVAESDDIPVLTEIYSADIHKVPVTMRSTNASTTLEQHFTQNELVELLQEVLAPLVRQEVKKTLQQQIAD